MRLTCYSNIYNDNPGGSHVIPIFIMMTTKINFGAPAPWIYGTSVVALL